MATKARDPFVLHRWTVECDAAAAGLSGAWHKIVFSAEVWAIALSVAALCALSGCISSSPYSHTYGLTYSPNTQIGAEVDVRCVVWGFGPEGGVTLWGRQQVVWWSATGHRSRKSVSIGSYDALAKGGDTVDIRGVMLGFSPDSRHLLVLVRGKLLVIQLSNSRKTMISANGDRVTSYCWLDNDRVAFATGPTSRKFFQANLHDPQGSRTQLAGEWGAVPEDGNFPYECWSPDGRFVAFLSGPLELRILEISTAKTLKYTIPYAKALAVTWEDESKPLCKTYYADRCPKLLFRIDLASGERTDLGEDPDCK